jgi:hypothetical protein
MSMQNPVQHINRVMTQLQSLMVCDNECQRRKHADELKEKWVKTKQMKQQLPELIDQAEEDYLKFVDGDFGYKQVLIERNKTIVQKHAQELNDTASQQLQQYNTLQNELTELQHTYENVKEYETTQQKKANTIHLDLDNQQKNTQTNDRRVEYEEQSIEQIQQIYTFLWYLYYVVLLLWIGYTNPIYANITTNIFSLVWWFKHTIIIFFPWIVIGLSHIIQSLYHSFYIRLPKTQSS